MFRYLVTEFSLEDTFNKPLTGYLGSGQTVLEESKVAHEERDVRCQVQITTNFYRTEIHLQKARLELIDWDL